MDIERLKELREEVFEDYKAYMVKNLKDEDGKVYPSTVPLDECSPIGKDLLELIDEAIARQSVTSGEVADAIDDFEKIKNNYMRTAKAFEGSRDPMYEESCKSIGRYDLAIAALHQHQKPTDEAVHPDDLDSATEDAVEWLNHMKSCHIDSWNNADDEDTAEPGAYEQYRATLKALDLAIQSLRQMDSTKHSTDSTRATGDLKPCPFCGNPVEIVPEGDYVEIVCEECGIAMSRSSEKWLIADWNKRAGDSHD